MKQWQKLTDMVNNTDIVDEMIKKYKNTILGIRTPTNSIYAYYIGTNNDGMFLFRDHNEQHLKIAKNTDMEIFIPNPEKGLYNTKYGAVMYQRNPKRQWKRGLNSENVQAFTIVQTITHRGRPSAQQNKFDIVWNDILTNENDSILMSNAKEIADDLGSAAINRTYGIVLHPTEKFGYILMHHKYQIGIIENNKIRIMNKIFRQEVLDTQNQWCPTYEVL